MNVVAHLNLWSLLGSAVALLLATCALARVIMTAKLTFDAEDGYTHCGGDEWHKQERRILTILDGTENYRTAPKRMPAPDFVPPVVRNTPVKSVRDVPLFYVALATIFSCAVGFVVAVITRRV